MSYVKQAVGKRGSSQTVDRRYADIATVCHSDFETFTYCLDGGIVREINFDYYIEQTVVAAQQNQFFCCKVNCQVNA